MMSADVGATFGAAYPGATLGATGSRGDGTGVGTVACAGSGLDCAKAGAIGTIPLRTASKARMVNRIRCCAFTILPLFDRDRAEARLVEQ